MNFFCGIQNIVNRIIRQRKSKCGICKGNDFAIADIGEILLDLQKSYFSNFQWTILVSIIFRAILISLAFMYTLRRLKYFHHRVGKNASQIEKKMIYSYSNVGFFTTPWVYWTVYKVLKKLEQTEFCGIVCLRDLPQNCLFFISMYF